MSWSTSIQIDAEPDELPVLTDEMVDVARDTVREKLDEQAEYDTFDGAVAGARALLEFGPGSRLVYISGHANSTSRSCNANVVLPTA